MLAASFRESLLSTDSEASSSQLLRELGEGLFVLGNIVNSLGAVELDVAVRGKVWSNTTVSTVGSAATLLGTLNNDVGDDALVNIEALGFAVGLEVDEQETDSLDRLFGPSTGVGADHLALGVSLSEMLSEANNSLVVKNLIQVGNSLLDFHALNSVGGVVSVLVVGALVLDLGLGGLGWLNWLSKIGRASCRERV